MAERLQPTAGFMSPAGWMSRPGSSPHRIQHS